MKVDCRHILAVLLFLKSYYFFPQFIQTRDLPLKERLKIVRNERDNTLFFAPLNLFDFVNPCFQLGYERQVTGKFAWQMEGGPIINHSIENYLIDFARGVKNCPYTNKGFKIKTELKYFVLQKKRVAGYVSVELFYLQNRSGVVADFRIADTAFQYSAPRPAGTNGYEDFFYNEKKKYGVNIKFGLKFINNRFVFEPHVGLGIAYRTVSQFGRENPKDPLADTFLNWDKEPGSRLAFSLPLNFKLGYIF